MSTARPDPSPAPRRRVRRRRAFLPMLAGLLAAALLLAVSTRLFGLVHGVEFSPNTFRRRSYFYYEVPLVRIQASPIVHAAGRRDLPAYLRQRRLVLPKTNQPAHWDLVYSDRVGAPPVQGDAAILCKYLDALNEKGEPYWLAWSKKRPALARVLWPVVAQVARRGLYIFIPDLFQAAQHSTKPSRLREDLDRVVARRYAWLAAVRQQLGDNWAAVQLYTQGLNHAPNDKALLAGRARSRQRLHRQRPAP